MIVAALLLSLSPALAAEHGEAPSGVPTDAPVFVNLQPIVLPVIERNAVTRQIGILLTLELGKDQTSESIEPKRRQLVDAFVQELYRLYDARSGASRVVDEAVVKAHLQRTADSVLGPGVVHAILIRQLMEQQR
jgi:flagellar FliL protein